MLAIVVLAAGEGKRMKSALPKVLHSICGEPMIMHVLDAARALAPDLLLVVAGRPLGALGQDVEMVEQAQPLGTGHAVLQAAERLSGLEGEVMVLSGDVPLMRASTLQELVEMHRTSGNAATILTACLDDPRGYGRIIRGADSRVTGIIEDQDATGDQVKITEINTGSYCFDREALFDALKDVRQENRQGEFYLTDVIALMSDRGSCVGALRNVGCEEVMGVNSRWELAVAEGLMRRRVIERHMEEGVTFIDPDSTVVGTKVVIGPDSTIHGGCAIYGETVIGGGCIIGPRATIHDSKIGSGAKVEESVVRESVIGDGCLVGPYCSLRPGTVLGNRAKAGTFVEIKNSEVGEGGKVPHLSYMGDATIGPGANVGAGSITCNYDGIAKHRTIIEEGAFIGSDTMLVAPVRIGKKATTGAGSAITRDVPDDGLGVERSKQVNVERYQDKRNAKRRSGGKGMSDRGDQKEA